MRETRVNLALRVLEELIHVGVSDFCVCPGTRNSEFVILLDNQDSLKPYYFYEERSAAFFALGKAKSQKRAVAVITTSGTATAELLPAVMESYYSGVPLVVVTADRPRKFRGTGAPQSAEQVGLYGPYVSCAKDLEGDEVFDLSDWDRKSPLHLNVCLKDPNAKFEDKKQVIETGFSDFDSFLSTVSYPVVVVSYLSKEEKEALVPLLLKLNAPLFLEGISNVREDTRLQKLQIRRVDNFYKTAVECNYPIDGVIRIGGVPTFRFWRDIEELKIPVFSISDRPFKGLTHGSLIQTKLSELQIKKQFSLETAKTWLENDLAYLMKLQELFKEEPAASPSLIHALSLIIPKNAHVYLGNSLPIREWDLSATFEDKNFLITASRGVNGIDGQLSTFFGHSTKERDNFAILGDLTTLYDLAAPWILPQMKEIKTTVFVINNGGGKIFSNIFASLVFQNQHQISFKPFAALWGMEYERWEAIPDKLHFNHVPKLIEIIPDNEATNRFTKKLLSF